MGTATATNAAHARAASDRAFTCENKGDLAGARDGLDRAQHAAGGEGSTGAVDVAPTRRPGWVAPGG